MQHVVVAAIMYSGVALTAAKTLERQKEREMCTSEGVSLAAVSTPHATKHLLPLPLKRTKE